MSEEPAVREGFGQRIEIRTATQVDATALAASDELTGRDTSRWALIDHAIQSDQCVVALVDRKPVGCVVLTNTFFGRGFVELLYVQQEYRRQGIGSALISYVEARCSTSTLFTSTNESNAPMQSFLASVGYQPSGRIENLDEGDPRQAVAILYRGQIHSDSSHEDHNRSVASCAPSRNASNLAHITLGCTSVR